MPPCEDRIVCSSKLNQRWGEASVNSSRWKSHKPSSPSYANFIRIGNIHLGIHFCSLADCLWGWAADSCLYTYGYGWRQNSSVRSLHVVSHADEWYFASIAHFSFTGFISWFSFCPLIFVKISPWIFGIGKCPDFLVTLKNACISAFCNMFIFLPQASYHWSFREPGTSCLERKRLKGVMMNVHKHIKACPWKRRGTNYPH